LLYKFKAAHCLIGNLAIPLSVSVVVGSSYRNGEGGQRYLAGRIIHHPDYIPGPNVYDIAIVRTISRITFNSLVRPIQLAENFIGVGATGTFVGWGFVGYGAILPRIANVLQRMNITTIANDDCKQRYSVTHRGEFVVDQKLCVVSGPRTSVCGG
jgi:Trypsin